MALVGAFVDLLLFLGVVPDFGGRPFLLRLLIDSDGSIAKVDVVSDPGEGLGPAAAQAVRELRFSPAKVHGVAVATTVPFTIHFTLD